MADAENSKLVLAGQDAKRLKKLVGALRYLFRNSTWDMIWSFFFIKFFPEKNVKF